jgi:hypothetical protein
MSKKKDKVCARCGKRTALYLNKNSKYNSDVRYSADHDLCQQCYRAERNKHRRKKYCYTINKEKQ